MKLQQNKQLTKTKDKYYTYLAATDEDGTYRADVHANTKYQSVLEYLTQRGVTVQVEFNDTADGYYCLIDERKVTLYGGRF